MTKVTIEIDAKWVKLVHSPFFWLIATFQGAAISFSPLFLYWSGKSRFFPQYEWIVVPFCFVTILMVGLFYMRLGGEVISELRRYKSFPPQSR